MAKKPRLFFQVILFMLIMVKSGDCIWLNLPKSGRKCVTEEIHNNVVVLADYVVISDVHIHPTPSITTKVTSPYGNVLHHKENATHGQFAFTTSEAGQYLVCFWADDPNQGGALSVNIDWKTGIAAKDWESVARREKIELEGAVEAIHDNLLYLKGSFRCTTMVLNALFPKEETNLDSGPVTLQE
ncbi:GOLD-like protein [Cynara cardunculus var. scolymus]|uniref:GOLD-like protein n=1 Tax=Cynara cardunculus var. scolymus TaxID=59895 RepID=A0A118JVQ0_CYNCS|nr:GOLD-like protein [Cynara cardunculus var. scolymus]